ncbi:hypothetical protein TeGR_g6797, partial [Tetraparma gracilis]
SSSNPYSSYNDSAAFRLPSSAPKPAPAPAAPAAAVQSMSLGGPSRGGGGGKGYREAFEASGGAAPAAAAAAAAAAAKPAGEATEVTFGGGALGMTLEEVGESGDGVVSVVTSVVAGGQAAAVGVRPGDRLYLIDGRAAISHAYAVATIKDRKRPMKLGLLR